MAHANAASVRASTARRDIRPVRSGRLFKADHPRAIDRYIDYFGGAGGSPAADPCGERLLDLLDRRPWPGA